MRGVLQTLEAVLGVMVILIGLTTVYPVREKGEFQLSTTGYNCLRQLDQEGNLKYFVENDLVIDLNNSLRDCIPRIADFTFKICNTDLCNPDVVPQNKEIFVANYLVAGHESFENNLVSLWLWLK